MSSDTGTAATTGAVPTRLARKITGPLLFLFILGDVLGAGVALVAALNARGISESLKSNVVMTMVELTGLLIVIAVVAIMLVGFETSANVVEEIRNPTRVYPRALFGSLITAGIIYALVGLASAIALPPRTWRSRRGLCWRSCRPLRWESRNGCSASSL